jgi:hypothetical protein
MVGLRARHVQSTRLTNRSHILLAHPHEHLGIELLGGILQELQSETSQWFPALEDLGWHYATFQSPQRTCSRHERQNTGRHSPGTCEELRPHHPGSKAREQAMAKEDCRPSGD